MGTAMLMLIWIAFCSHDLRCIQTVIQLAIRGTCMWAQNSLRKTNISRIGFHDAERKLRKCRRYRTVMRLRKKMKIEVDKGELRILHQTPLWNSEFFFLLMNNCFSQVDLDLMYLWKIKYLELINLNQG